MSIYTKHDFKCSVCGKDFTPTGFVYEDNDNEFVCNDCQTAYVNQWTVNNAEFFITDVAGFKYYAANVTFADGHTVNGILFSYNRQFDKIIFFDLVDVITVKVADDKPEEFITSFMEKFKAANMVQI